MTRQVQFGMTFVRAAVAGLACTAVATSAYVPVFAAPARMPVISAAENQATMPYLIQTQQSGGGTGGTGGGTAGTGRGTSTSSPNSLTGSGSSSGGPKARIFYFINSNATDRISEELAESLGACSPDRLERRYRIDCLRLHFWRLSQDLPSTGDYAPVRAALAKAAADLDAIVRQNLDTSAPRLRVRANGKPAAPLLPPIRAVRAGTEARVAKQAERVIAEATTALLRSTENSDRRMTHYQQIASAISSTKVLLRSA